MHRPQDDLLLILRQPDHVGIVQLPCQHIGLGDDAHLVSVLPHLADQGRRVGVDPLGLEQDEVAEFEFPDDARPVEQADDGPEFVVGECHLLLPRLPSCLGQGIAAEQDRRGYRLLPPLRRGVGPVLDPDDDLLQFAERVRRDGVRDGVPVDVADDGLCQLLAAVAGVGASLDIRPELVVLAELVDQAAGDHRAAAVAAAGDEELGEGPPGGPAEHAVPLGQPGERVAVLRVEDEHRQGCLVHVERVGEPVVGLAGEVPEPDLPLAVLGPGLVGQRPVRGPGGVGREELSRRRAGREPVGQAGLADARITHEQHLGVRVGRLAKRRQVPDAEGVVP